MNQKQKSGVRSQKPAPIRAGSVAPADRRPLTADRSAVIPSPSALIPRPPVLTQDSGLRTKDSRLPQIRLVPSGKTIQITPGLAIQPAPLAAVPAFGVIEWHRHADGRFEPRLVTKDEWFALADDMFAKLGLSISRETLIRLGRSGFIRLRRPTPGLIEVNLESLITHFENCEEEDFWTEERIEQYREAP